MGSLFSKVSNKFSKIDFKKDFDDVILDLNIDKNELTKENFVDKIYFTIDDKYPKKKSLSHFNAIIKELEEFGKRLQKIKEKYPDDNEKKELKEFIDLSIMKIIEINKLLNKSKLNAPNNTSNSKSNNLQKNNSGNSGNSGNYKQSAGSSKKYKKLRS